jgi:hypothetical protein
MSNPTMIISCPYCHSRQRVPIPVADGTDPWFCEQCGRTIELPRRDFSADDKRRETKGKENG